MSCGHRSYPKCQNYDTSRWIDRQTDKLLPVQYYMATFTLPYELRALTLNHQHQVYSIRYTESKTGKVGYRTLKGENFLRLILQLVLPKGFRRVRDFGFLLFSGPVQLPDKIVVRFTHTIYPCSLGINPIHF